MAKINRRATIDEAAKQLGKSRTQILVACDKLKIETHKNGQSRKLDASEMEMLREYFESESETDSTDPPRSTP